MDAFEALADPVRRALLDHLGEGAARVVDLAAALPVSRPAVSRHLRLLGDAGLVEADDVGRERHYRLRTEPLAEVASYVAGLRAPLRESALDALATEVRRTTRERRRPSSSSTPTEESETA